MSVFILNQKQVLTLAAPSSAGTLAFKLGNVEFSTDFDTDEATTVDNFVAEHGTALEKLGILAYDAGDDLALYGVGQSFSTENTLTISDETLTPPADIVSTGIDNDGNLSIVVSTGGTNTTTLTGEYHSVESRDEDRIRLVNLTGLGRDSVIFPNSASRWVAS